MGKSTRGASISLAIAGVLALVIMIGALYLGVLVNVDTVNEAQEQIDYYEDHPLERDTYELLNGKDPVEENQQYIENANTALLIFIVIALGYLLLAIIMFVGAKRAANDRKYGFVLVASVLSVFCWLILFLVPLILTIRNKEAFGQAQEIQPDTPKDEVKDKLERLKAMKDDGLLTDDEYNEKKKQVLDEM